MRKYIIISLVLVCLASAGLLWAFADINGQQDDITVKETSEGGKVEATKGIKVTTKIQDERYKLNWTTDMYLAGTKDIKTETQFTYDRQGDIKLLDDITTKYCLMDSFSQHFIHLSTWDEEKAEVLGTGLPMKLAKDAYDASGDEEEYQFYCNLDDYMDYLPITLDIKDDPYVMSRINLSYDIDHKLLDWTHYFRFPIPEDFSYMVDVQKPARLVDHEISLDFMAVSDKSFYYEVKSDGVWDGENLYLAVSGIENVADGNILSNLPPDKKGIHVFPTKAQQNVYLDLAQGKRVYQIDQDAQVLCLRESENGDTLYLVTESPDGVMLEVVDKKTFACIQMLPLNQKVAGKEFNQFRFAGDHGIFLLFERGVFLLIEEKDGVYEEALTGNIGHIIEESCIDCDYDGERLVIAMIDWESNVIESQVRVFDKTGCLYRGRYDYTNSQYYYDEDDGGWGYEKRVYVEFTDEI